MNSFLFCYYYSSFFGGANKTKKPVQAKENNNKHEQDSPVKFKRRKANAIISDSSEDEVDDINVEVMKK